jgi:ATP/maltotriose-dependent transcriptional regulator MalT
VFRDALQYALELRADPATRAALHRRASGWFASQGRVAEAIRHAVDGDDWECVGRLCGANAARPPVDILPVPDREAVLGALVEPLTRRELEVLALVAGRLTNKEIARALEISWQTVTKHTVNLYQKLQVTNRREAVRCARALGLLPPGDPGESSPGALLRAVPRRVARGHLGSVSVRHARSAR